MEELEPGSFNAYLRQDGGIPSTGQEISGQLNHAPYRPPFKRTVEPGAGGDYLAEVQLARAGWALLGACGVAVTAAYALNKHFTKVRNER